MGGCPPIMLGIMPVCPIISIMDIMKGGSTIATAFGLLSTM
jgi:hypothetical protein